MHDQPTCGPELSLAKVEVQHRNDVLRFLLEDYSAAAKSALVLDAG